MSTTTWTQYVAMDDGDFDPALLDAAIQCMDDDWDDDFDLAEPGPEDAMVDFDDPE